MEKDFKNIVGQVEEGKPAVIRFFGPVDQYSTANFNYEFLWLQEYVKPSLIQIQINSEGGSVLNGMSTYSVIQNCPIPTECVNEGLAASMASIIWAAGNKSLMRDYSILMIHNPFHKDSDDSDENGCGKEEKSESTAVTDAFRKQIETIYVKRWGLSESKVKKIMEGEEGEDGTFFDAKEAVEAGIIPAENVIKTQKQSAKKVKAAIQGISSSVDFRLAMDKVIAQLSTNKLDQEKESNIKANEGVDLTKPQEIKDIIKNEKMEDKLELSLISAALGLQGSVTSSEVLAKIPTLVQEAKKASELQGVVNSLNIELTGSKQALKNVESSLDEVKAELENYKKAERETKEKEIDTAIDAAIEAGKIKAESKETWVTMAKTDFALVTNTLASIPVAEKISAVIENDPKLVEEKSKTAAQEVEAKVSKVIGEGFTFKKL